MKRFLGFLLCCIGIHKWEFITDNKIFPFTHYKYCKRCGQININF